MAGREDREQGSPQEALRGKCSNVRAEQWLRERREESTCHQGTGSRGNRSGGSLPGFHLCAWKDNGFMDWGTVAKCVRG